MFGRSEKFTFDAKKLKRKEPKGKNEIADQELGAKIDTPMSAAAVAKVDTEAEPKARPKRRPREKKDKPQGKLPLYRNKKVIGVLLIALSLVITLGVNPTLDYLHKEETVTAVVAVMDVEVGKQITAEMISEISEPVSAILPIQELASSMVIGQYAVSKIVAGEILSKPKLSHDVPFSSAYLYTLPEQKKAISVSMTKLTSSLSGKLQAGDIVSVYVPQMTENKDVRSLAEQPPELAYVEVLSVTNVDGLDITESPDRSGLENPLPLTVTLAVDDIQAVILAGSEVRGGIQLALVSRGDDTAAAQLLAIQATFNSGLEQKKEVGGENE